MKHLQLVPILILIAIGPMIWPAAAELTAYQSLPSSANVGEMVMVTVSLTYNGQSPTEAEVTPHLSGGVVANSGSQRIELYPGVTQQVSYAFTSQQSGSYLIVSDISWMDGGNWRSLSLEAPFTAIATAPPQGSATGAEQNGSINPQGPPAAPAIGPLPGDYPHANDTQPENTQPESGDMPGGEMPADARMTDQKAGVFDPHRAP